MANQVTIIKPPLYGSVIWDGSNFIYTPQQGFVGQDFYIYTITDGITSQTLTNYTNTINSAPSARNINLTTNAEDVLTIDLVNYVTDDGLVGPYRISNITTPNIGVVGYANNIIKYRSNGFDGIDQFYYTVTDGQYNSTATITLSIINGNNIQVPQYITDQLNALEVILTDVQANSADWDTTYTILCTSSAKWNDLNPSRYNAVSNIVETTSSDWNSILSSKPSYDQSYTVVNSNSSDWNYVRDNISFTNTALTGNSANWITSYNLLCANSSKWADTTVNLNNLTNIFSTYSGSWNSAYSLVQGSSSGWDKTYYLNILSAGSGNWNISFSLLNANSANWNNNTNNINTLTSLYSQNSGNWRKAYNTVYTLSNGWGDQSAITLLSTTSADWNKVANAKPNYDSAVTVLSTTSADWNYVKDNFGSLVNTTSSNSGYWNTSYSTVCSNSAGWNNAYNSFVNVSTNYTNNSANWTTAYNTVCAGSAVWSDTTIYNVFSSNSASWNGLVLSKPNYDSVVTIVSSTSADWNYVKDNFGSLVNTTSSNSGYWNTSYSTVCSNSAGWNNAYNSFVNVSTNYTNNSANWTTAYNTVCTTSSNWDKTTINNILTSNSGNWNSSYINLTSNSGYWNSSYNILSNLSTNYFGNSANWTTAYNTVCAGSAVWSDTTIYNVVTANSGYWNGFYNSKSLYDSAVTVLSTTSADWNYVRNNFTPISNLVSSGSANWNNTYSTVSSNSGSWNTITGNISTITNNYSANSGNWNNTFILVSTNSAYWDNNDTIQLVNDNYPNWNTSYTILCTTSGSWELNKTNLTNLTNNYNLSSVLWNSYYNVVTAGSSNWGDATAVSIITAQSGNYANTYSVVCANSSTWNSVSSVYTKYDNTYSVVCANSASWNNTFNTVSSNSGTWNNTTTLISANSGAWLNGATNLNFTTNNLIVSGNAIFYGSLTADGATTQLNTSVVATSAFYLNNTGNVDALAVTKTTTVGALANFSNAGGSVLYVDPNNKVGINTSSPSEALTVVGNISASGLIYGQVPTIYTVFQSNSGRYETTSSYVNLSSVTINQLLTTSKPSYDTAYTYVTGVSTTISNFISVNKPSYDTAYNTVTSQSGTVYTSYTFLTAQSGKIGTDTIYRAKSANYESAYTWVQNNSGAAAAVSQINVIFDGGGDIINSGSYVIIQIPAKIGIVNWTLYSDIATTNSYIDVLSCDYANYPTFVRISPASNTDANYVKIISGTQKAPNIIPTTLTGWTTGVAADSLLKFNLIANSTATLLTLSLKCIKLS